MTDPKPYLYAVNNILGCVLRVSDYGFCCVIYADSADDALSWGIQVATEYADRFGFPPHNLKPDRAEVTSNSYVMECDEDPERADCVCCDGSFPDVLH